MCVCVGGGGKQNRSLSGGTGIYKSVPGDIINACAVVLNPGGGGGGGGGGLFAIIVIHRGVLWNSTTAITCSAWLFMLTACNSIIPIFIHFVVFFNSV